jgi:hypothetical protein
MKTLPYGHLVRNGGFLYLMHRHRQPLGQLSTLMQHLDEFEYRRVACQLGSSAYTSSARSMGHAGRLQK